MGWFCLASAAAATCARQSWAAPAASSKNAAQSAAGAAQGHPATLDTAVETEVMGI